MERTQFTFYESFVKALSRIRKKADRADAYDAICMYALYGVEPDIDRMQDLVAIAFELIRPTLDASRRKARNGKAGVMARDESKTGMANGKQSEKCLHKTDKQNEVCFGNCNKQTESKKENKIENKIEDEVEIKREIEVKNECYNPLPPYLPNSKQELQNAFGDWLAYKKERREAYKPVGLRNLITQIENKAAEYGDETVAALIRECMASNWKGIIFDRLKEQTKPADTAVQGRRTFSEIIAEAERSGRI